MATETAGTKPSITPGTEEKKNTRSRAARIEQQEQQPFQSPAFTREQADALVEAKIKAWSEQEQFKKLVTEVAKAQTEQGINAAKAEIEAGLPVKDENWNKLHWSAQAEVLRRLGMHTEAAIFEHRMLGIGTGKYERDFSTRVEEIWEHRIRVKDVVIVGGIALIAMFLYELVAERSGWPSFNLFVTPGSANTIGEGGEGGTMTRSEAGARGGRASR
jgi:hypothetical protein